MMVGAMGVAGFEPSQKNSEKTTKSWQRGAKCGALPLSSLIQAPDLARLVVASADLPAPIRKGILGMVDAVKG
jgi:hypothetical protein